MHVEGGDKARNLRHAEQCIAQAAAKGADLALLPECLNLGWTHPSAHTDADSIPHGESCRRLSEAARQHRIFVCSGLVEQAPEGVYNSAVLLDRDGTLLLRHRKLNELNIGHEYYGQGESLGVAHTELGSLGLMICADAFARDQVLTRALGYMGADVILSPSAWAVPADHDNAKDPYGQMWRESYARVARDFSLWVIGVSNVGPVTAGPWAGWRCIGCSLVIDPDGNEVVQGPYGVDADTILYVTVQPRTRPARGTDWHGYWSRSNQR
jgi:predicted amidohydrolase